MRSAGVIAAAADNRKGIVGVDWNAKIMPLKTLAADGSGSLANAAAAIRFAVDHGARVINASWGSDLPDDAPSLATLPRHRDGSLIPALPLPKEIRNGPAMSGGPNMRERDAARHAAETRLKHAQQEWLATATEEAWARWKEGGG